MSDIKNITPADFENLKNTNDVYLIDFWAAWCGPCKVMLPILKDLAIDVDLEDKINFVKVDVDQCPELSEMFDISSIPTFYLVKFSGDGTFDLNKNIVEKFVGAQGAFQFKLDLQKALAKLG